MSSLLQQSAFDELVAAPPLTEADLTGTFWAFGQLGRRPYANFLVLAPGGRIGNYRNRHEDGWVIIDGQLALMSDRGIPTTVFDSAHVIDGDVTSLLGVCRQQTSGSPIIHALRRVDHPAHPLHATPSSVERRAHFLKKAPRPARPNLIVLRAGEASLHGAWPRDIAEASRSWDLCISYYGADPAAVLDQAEYVTHQPHQRKFQALHDCFFPGSPLWNYGRIWFPDDDLMLSWSDINHLFHISRRSDLDLAQPALLPSEDCPIAHRVTARQPDKLLRYGDFVEIMCPLFSPAALRLCIGSFRDSVSGFGLDYLWPSLLGGPRARIAIIDAVGISHTRRVAGNYDLRKAIDEGDAHRAAYRFVPYNFAELAVAI